jgi:hypothetical protein
MQESQYSTELKGAVCAEKQCEETKAFKMRCVQQTLMEAEHVQRIRKQRAWL